MIVLSILSDAFFAAIAGIGFGAISDPPIKAFRYIALLAAVGHASRYFLMMFVGIDITTASFIASFIIGMGSLWFGKKIYSPMTVLYIPALLPMIPGKYAYNMVFSLIMFLQSMEYPVKKNYYMDLFFSNTMIAATVIFALAVGATFPMFLFPKQASSLTRNRKWKLFGER
ncbi:threonine/serine exporter family protein [Proteiniphilum sp. UBA5384]|uniref:threonine/serine exporter family protein n=1 Tax=Proteiniphilum sp. UBA5384 TaxID=1947279 RepID=UPI0025F9A38C|nr:threonine/serine exporter family protein [Proteiniphilum sp. UBA5384]